MRFQCSLHSQITNNNHIDFIFHIHRICFIMNLLQFLFAIFSYDIHRLSRECISLGLTCQTVALSTVCYFIGVLIHVAVAKTDDRISLSSKNWNLWPTMKVCYLLVLSWFRVWNQSIWSQYAPRFLVLHPSRPRTIIALGISDKVTHSLCYKVDCV